MSENYFNQYNLEDIVCVWIDEYYKDRLGNNYKKIQGFGRVKRVWKNALTIEWIKIGQTKFLNTRKDKNLYQFIGERFTLLIEAKDSNGKEDWKSLMALIKIKS